ncbi:MAG: 50S ribosomal protein L24 [Rickettsiales bacterium]|nr:50S ribosomal protein L24 [Rickettsiales bacterium]
MKIRKGDEVIILTGKDKGGRGEVLFIDPKKSMVLVSGINQVKKHKKPSADSPGQVVNFEKPLHISNVSLIENNRPARVGFKIEDGKKVRIFKKSGKRVDK